EGTAMIYPISTMGAHVSDCPNHTVGRTTPFATRGQVALAGTFGYELDITKISSEDRAQIPEQVAMYHKYQELMHRGDYYRILSWNDQKPYDCWMVTAKDGSEALVTYVQVLGRANEKSKLIYLKGLLPDAEYQLEGTEEIYRGEELLNCGFPVRDVRGDFQSRLYHFVRR
ncbi:MAG: GH36 C-terminal domain-containing protein, partial [Lachnospiraceae bacterium]|nr:GH36 C-terminal domain-containing protein [Lachnospiraceae bacterium]